MRLGAKLAMTAASCLLAACGQAADSEPTQGAADGAVVDTAPPGPDVVVASPDVPVAVDVPIEPDAGPDVPHAGPDVPPDPCLNVISPGPAPLRRLTATEYNNTVRDLFGDDTAPASHFPEEETALGFDNNASVRGVTTLHAERFLAAAEDVAVRFIARLDDAFACDVAEDGERGCAEVFVRHGGLRIYRRPLEETEVDAYLGLYDLIAADEGYASALGAVLEAFLQSPHFLYRVEPGVGDPLGDGTVVALGPYELATRLSYFMWASAPDEALLTAAGDGELATAEGIEAQARRLLADPRARFGVANFHDQWLQLRAVLGAFRDPIFYRDFDAELRSLMRMETLRFVDHVVFDGAGNLNALLTEPYSVQNAALADFYDAGIIAPEEFAKVALDPQRRAGILTQGAIVASHAKFNDTSPVLRGKFIREQLLCQLLAPPPADLMVQAPSPDPNLTTRERYAQHSEDPACGGCHMLMDELGFIMEHYDPVGRWRDEELMTGLEVDAVGVVEHTVDADGQVYGAVELAHQLAGSGQVASCYVTQWWRYANGRAETGADECSLGAVGETFLATGGDIRELLVAVTQTDAFRYRPVVVPSEEEGP